MRHWLEKFATEIKLFLTIWLVYAVHENTIETAVVNGHSVSLCRPRAVWDHVAFYSSTGLIPRRLRRNRVRGLPRGEYLLFFLGLILNLKNFPFWILLLYILFTSVVAFVFFGDSRIRAPIQPYLYLFGVLGVQVTWRWLHA